MANISTTDPIIINKEEAWSIINFFWPGQANKSALDFDNQDIQFAQGLIKEAIEKSYNMGFIEVIARAVYWKIPVDFDSIKKIVFEICKGLTKHIFEHNVKKGDVKIYDMIKNTIALNYKSYWQIKVQTGEFL